MPMGPGLRKFALAVHLAFSVGWLGAVLAFLPLAIVGLTSQDPQMVRGAYLTMDLSVRFVIVPLALASLLTGVIQSLGTAWGLLRHYWVLLSLVLSVFANIVLLQQLETFRYLAGVAADTTLSGAELLEVRSLRPVVHAGGGLAVLLVIQVLNVYKPQGMTRYGRRKRDEQRRALQRSEQAKQGRVLLP